MSEEIETSEVQETPTAEEKPAWVESAEAVPGLEMNGEDAKASISKKRSIVSNEEFIRAWNQSQYVKDVAETLGISANSARARANKLRKIFAQAGVEINLKKHPIYRPKRKSLVNDMAELARLAEIASASIPTESDNGSEE